MAVEQEFQDLQTRTAIELQDLLDTAPTREQMRAAGEALQRLHALRSQFVLAEFNKATPAFLAQTELLQDVIDRIRADSPATPVLRTFNDLLAASSTIYAAVREPERLRAPRTAPTTSRSPCRSGASRACRPALRASRPRATA